MEGDHRQPPAGVQVLRGGLQHGRQRVQLAVDGDAYGLKAPLGRVLLFPQRCRGHGGLDDLHQLQRRLDGALLPRLHDASCDGGGVALLAVLKQNAPQLLIAPTVHYLAGGEVRGAIHPHVQRRVVHIAEAPLRIVQLRGRHTQVEQHAVRPVYVQFGENVADAVKIAVDKRDPVRVVRQPLLRGGDGRLVPVDADEPPGGQPLYDLQ